MAFRRNFELDRSVHFFQRTTTDPHMFSAFGSVNPSHVTRDSICFAIFLDSFTHPQGLRQRKRWMIPLNEPVSLFQKAIHCPCCNRHSLRNLRILSAFQRIAGWKTGFNRKVGKSTRSCPITIKFYQRKTEHKISTWLWDFLRITVICRNSKWKFVPCFSDHCRCLFFAVEFWGCALPPLGRQT